MCGICGEFSFDDATVAARADRHGGVLVPSRARSWRHFVAGRAVGFGFRRLSIIDLRSAANQPIGNEDGTIQLIFNGEIYNYRELRAPLVAAGHHFRSNSDSEVIVHLYEEHGEHAIDRLDGMFALALWDARRNELLLARDRAGKKPLFVWNATGSRLFCVGDQGDAGAPGDALQIDEQAIPYYFLHGYVPHPQTFYRDVTQVDPGTVVRVDRDRRTSARRYWELTFPPEDVQRRSPVSRQAATTRVRELVTAAVQRRLMSDVPLGAFLSGGIDSTVVVGVMSQLLDVPVRTFSIGFDGNEAFDETAVARETAAALARCTRSSA